MHLLQQDFFFADVVAHLLFDDLLIGDFVRNARYFADVAVFGIHRTEIGFQPPHASVFAGEFSFELLPFAFESGVDVLLQILYSFFGKAVFQNGNEVAPYAHFVSQKLQVLVAEYPVVRQDAVIFVDGPNQHGRTVENGVDLGGLLSQFLLRGFFETHRLRQRRNFHHLSAVVENGTQRNFLQVLVSAQIDHFLLKLDFLTVEYIADDLLPLFLIFHHAPVGELHKIGAQLYAVAVPAQHLLREDFVEKGEFVVGTDGPDHVVGRIENRGDFPRLFAQYPAGFLLFGDVDGHAGHFHHFAGGFRYDGV